MYRLIAEGLAMATTGGEKNDRSVKITSLSKTKKKIKSTQVEDNTNNGEGLFGISYKLIAGFLACSVLLVAVHIQLTKKISQNLIKGSIKTQNKGHTEENRVLIVAENVEAGYLEHVFDAFDLFGFGISQQSHPTEQVEDFYNVIWSHNYPFTKLKSLGPHQRINHFPGTGFITNKLTLSTTPKVPNLLKAFRLPEEKEQFLKYASNYPDKLWIQKSSSHRGISVEYVDNISVDRNNTLVQEYMSNPFLIDGKKFDIGIYAVLTSVEPLRAYIYDTESLIRFCAQPYLDPSNGKFNSTNLDSYVVGDDYSPIWLMPTLLRYYIGTNLSMKETLNTYLRTLGKDGNKIWSQIEATISSVYKQKEHHLARMSRFYQEDNGYNNTSFGGTLNQFFEMVRFDFIVDDELNVYLMEANMSPNLSSKHFPPNRILYEQVLHSYFNLVGMRGHHRGLTNGLDDIIKDKELSVYEDLCVSEECHLNCVKPECLICYFCLRDADKLHMKRAIYEHNSRWNFKRLLPSTDDEYLQFQLIHPENHQQLLDSNYIHVHWFRGKCLQDVSWCSYPTFNDNVPKGK